MLRLLHVLAFALLVISASQLLPRSALADVLILESNVQGLERGRVLSDTERLTVPAGRHVKVLRPGGDTQYINGPYDRVVRDITRGEPMNRQIWQRFRDEIGGTIGGTDGGRGRTGESRPEQRPFGGPPPTEHKAARDGNEKDCVSRDVCTPVLILFGTNRQRQDTLEHISFGPERGKQLALGTALVTVPKSHGRGEVERPSYWDLWDLLTGLKQDPRRHFVIAKDGVRIFESTADFINEMRSTRQGLHQFRDHAFAFVHGFNVSFEDALYRTAQIAFDLGARVNGVYEPFGLPFLYSWPSQGTFNGYGADEDSARLSLDHLKEFLQLVVDKSDAKNLHLIAHSMGNQPLLHVLEELAKDNRKVVFITLAKQFEGEARRFRASSLRGGGSGPLRSAITRISWPARPLARPAWQRDRRTPGQTPDRIAEGARG
jgi:pimeloyl-ACP methyl ester carboxylesterase